MTTITLTERAKTAKEKELVAIPLWEYEALVARNGGRTIREFAPTKKDKLEIARARREYARGNYVTLAQFSRELGLNRRK